MLHGKGFTLLEILVVLVIVAIAAALAFPNYTTPIEQARAANARNNLLAIYSAQQNYRNNNGSYCSNNSSSLSCAGMSMSATCGGSLALINCNLSLNIQDDGTYTYFCGGVTCTATRSSTPSTKMVLTLNTAINLTGGGAANPVCNTSNNWCP